MNVQVIRSVLRSSKSLNELAWRSTSSFNGASFLSSLAASNEHDPWMLAATKGQPTAIGVRAFSSSDDDEEPPSRILSDILERELAEEDEAGSTVMPSDLVVLKKKLEEDWRIVDGSMGSSGNGATTKLFKKESTTGGKISVVFHCQDTLEVEDSEGYDEDEEAAVTNRFMVLIRKAGKTMVLNCVSIDAEARVEGVAMTNEDFDNVVSDGIGSEIYQGPEFTELAEDLQEAFSTYVQTECGVGSDMAAFISMYSDYKEQTEYVQWLKGVQGVLS